MFLKLKRAALYTILLATSLLATNAGAQVKLSQINNGGTINTATDQCVAVRNGTTDELVTIGSLPNSSLANSSMTLAGHSVSLGGTQAFACGDLSNAGTACQAVAPANTTSTAHNFFTAYTSATGAFTKAQPACADLSNAAASCSTDTTNASNISSGTLSTTLLPSPFTSGTASGSTSKFATTTGTLTSGDCVKIDASSNFIDAGAACGSGGGGVTTFSAGTTGFTPNTATSGAVTLAGTLGVANGGTGTGTAFTKGSVVFAGTSGVYSQDNGNFFWNDSTDTLGIGTTSFGTVANFTINPNSTADNAATVQINTNNSANKGLVLQGVASQSGTMLAVQNSVGGTVASIGSGGSISSFYAPTAGNSVWFSPGAPATGTGTTAQPAFYFLTTGASAPTTWSTGGTYLGVDAASGFSGNFLDFHVNGGASVNITQSNGGMILGQNNVATASNPAQLFMGEYQSGATTPFPSWLLNSTGPNFIGLGQPDTTTSVSGIRIGAVSALNTQWSTIGTVDSRIALDGHVGIATASPSAQLDVEVPTTSSVGLIVNNASSTTVDIADFKVGGSTLAKIDKNGAITSGAGLTLTGTTATIVNGQPGIVIRSGANSGNNVLIEPSASETPTSGNTVNLNTAVGFGPSSGTGTWADIESATTINQTSTATGISRGFYANPTLTQAYDFRALEVAAYTDTLLGNPVAGTFYQTLFNQPTVAAVTAAQTVTTASTVDIKNAPAAGTNITITNAYALNVEAGTSFLGGAINAPNLSTSSAAQTGTVCWTTGTGNFTVDTTTTCLLSLEDLKDKHGDITHALDTIMKLEPFWFTWKKETPEYAGDKAEQPGLGAHQVESVDKRLAAYGDDGKVKGVRYQEMTAVLVAAMKEQQKEIESLKIVIGIFGAILVGNILVFNFKRRRQL